MRYRHCIFDLYGTLVDIHTDERSPPAVGADGGGIPPERGAVPAR